MDWTRIKGRWTELKGAAKETWGELTDDDLLEAQGEREKLAGKLQQKYGYAKAEAERRLDDWSDRLADDGGVTKDEVREAAEARREARAAGESGDPQTLAESWRDMTGALKEKWAALTEDDLAEVKGDRDRLVAKLQEKYGHAKDHAERQVDAWIAQARRSDG